MDKNCKVIQDLLPLYIERLSSKETNLFIENNLKNCYSCNEVLNELKQKVNVPRVDEKDAIRKFYIKLKYKIIKIVLISNLFTILITFLVCCMLFC